MLGGPSQAEAPLPRSGFVHGEGFRVPAGVRKPLMQEPAGHGLWLWGFRVAADVGGSEDIVGKRRDGYSQGTSLPLRTPLKAPLAVGCCSVGVGDHHGHARVRCRRLNAGGWKLVHGVPGHGGVSRIGADASGGPRGCFHRSNTSTTNMRPPQQGHAGRKSSGSPCVSSSGGAATLSSSRANARPALREPPASRP